MISGTFSVVIGRWKANFSMVSPTLIICVISRNLLISQNICNCACLTLNLRSFYNVTKYGTIRHNPTRRLTTPDALTAAPSSTHRRIAMINVEKWIYKIVPENFYDTKASPWILSSRNHLSRSRSHLISSFLRVLTRQFPRFFLCTVHLPPNRSK